MVLLVSMAELIERSQSRAIYRAEWTPRKMEIASRCRRTTITLMGLSVSSGLRSRCVSEAEKQKQKIRRKEQDESRRKRLVESPPSTK